MKRAATDYMSYREVLFLLVYKSIQDLWSYKKIFFAAFISIILVFIACSTVAFFLHFTKSLVNENVESGVVNVFLRDGLTEKDRKALEGEVARQSFVAEVEYTSKKKALEDFSKSVGLSEKLRNDFSEVNPLPASLEVRIDATKYSQSAFSSFKASLEKKPEVEHINGDVVFLEKMRSVSKALPNILIFLGVLTALVAFYVLSHSLLLISMKRGSEFEILNYLGASTSRVFLPSILSLFYVVGLGIVCGFYIFVFLIESLREQINAVVGMYSVGAFNQADFTPQLYMVALFIFAVSLISVVFTVCRNVSR